MRLMKFYTGPIILIETCEGLFRRTGACIDLRSSSTGFPFFDRGVNVALLRKGAHKTAQVSFGKADGENSIQACQRCRLTRPNAVLSPWR
jgi:hypothetical protein